MHNVKLGDRVQSYPIREGFVNKDDCPVGTILKHAGKYHYLKTKKGWTILSPTYFSSYDSEYFGAYNNEIVCLPPSSLQVGDVTTGEEIVKKLKEKASVVQRVEVLNYEYPATYTLTSNGWWRVQASGKSKQSNPIYDRKYKILSLGGST